ncbi:hypothetical protein BaRGS_00011129, partial [Batillaria attramentaria]
MSTDSSREPSCGEIRSFNNSHSSSQSAGLHSRQKSVQYDAQPGILAPLSVPS